MAKTEDLGVLDSLQWLFALEDTDHCLLGHCRWRRFQPSPPPTRRRNRCWNCWWHPVSSWPGWCLPGWCSFRRSLFVRKYSDRWRGQTAFGHCWRVQELVESATMRATGADSRRLGWDQRKRQAPLHSMAQIDCSWGGPLDQLKTTHCLACRQHQPSINHWSIHASRISACCFRRHHLRILIVYCFIQNLISNSKGFIAGLHWHFAGYSGRYSDSLNLVNYLVELEILHSSLLEQEARTHLRFGDFQQQLLLLEKFVDWFWWLQVQDCLLDCCWRYWPDLVALVLAFAAKSFIISWIGQ